MKYSWEFKVQCVEKYLNGEWEDQPEYSRTTRKRFRKMIAEWSRIYRIQGAEGLKYKPGKEWTAAERYELVNRAIKEKATPKVAIEAGVSAKHLNKWIAKYRESGYAGLQYKKERNPEKTKEEELENKMSMTKEEKELLRQLKRENEYLKTENAYLKKLQALIAEEEAEKASKAKKQVSSENSAKKGID